MNNWLTSLGEAISGLPYMTSIADFMHQGGIILWCLFVLICLFWILVIERVLFLVWEFPEQKAKWFSSWQERGERTSWHAHAIRDGWLSEAKIALFRNVSVIKVLVSLCPMLGLLGTVTGMISVFDVMAEQGNGDPKLMASGIALATIPTMAGMVAALIGMFIHSRLVKLCNKYCFQLEQGLRSEV